MYKPIFISFFLFLSFIASLAQAQWSGLGKIDDAARAAKAPKVAEAAEAAKIASRFNFTSNITTNIQDMEVHVVFKEDLLCFRSNYKPIDFPGPVQVTTKADEQIDAKAWIKYLAYGEDHLKPNINFDRAFKNNITITIDPTILQHSSFKNIDWGSNKNINVFDGERIYNTIPFVNNNGKVERIAKIEKNVYARITPDEFCTAMDYTGLMKDVYAFLNNSNEIELTPENTYVEINHPSIQQGIKKETIKAFINEISSTGFTLISATCTAEDKIEKYVFGVYEEPTNSDLFLKAADKVGEVKVKIDLKAQEENKEGWGFGWYLLIGFIALWIIGSLVKD